MDQGLNARSVDGAQPGPDALRRGLVAHRRAGDGGRGAALGRGVRVWVVRFGAELSERVAAAAGCFLSARSPRHAASVRLVGDRKSTRLNSSHGYISYAVFCLKKKKR